jgi:CubicO group peptidase (beta-lactamase class C family)
MNMCDRSFHNACMRFAFVAGMTLIAGITVAQHVSKEVVVPGLGAKLDNYMRRLSSFDYSGSCLVESKGQIILDKGYGYANREKHIPIKPDTLFEIGSLGKQFTATEILLLIRQGKLHLNDSLGVYFPDAPDWLKKVEIRNLLTHTGGIPSVFGFQEVVGKDEMLKRIFAGQPKFAPGEQFEYSNEGFTLLAAIVEKITERKFQDVITDDLFKPAGMTSTGFLGMHVAPVPAKRFALGYDEAGVTFDPLHTDSENWTGIGCGDITSDLIDLHKWFHTIFETDFLTKEEKEEMFTPVKPSDKPSASWFTSDYGFGWFVQTLPNGHKRIQHGGDGYGFGSVFAWYPDDQFLVITLCNTRHDIFPDEVRGGRVLAQINFGDDHVEPPAVVNASNAYWNRFLGTYRTDAGDKLTIYRRGDQVMIGADGEEACELLDQPSADEKAKIEAQEITNKATIPKLFAKDYAFMEKLHARKPFVDGVNDEIATYGKKLGKPLGARSLGTYEGGFADFATVWELQFEKGTLPYKITWNENAIQGTWNGAPYLYSAPTPLQLGTDGKLVGWNLITKRGFSIAVSGDKLTVSGPNVQGTATRIPTSQP